MALEQGRTLSPADLKTQAKVYEFLNFFFARFNDLQVQLHDSFPMTGPSMALMAHFSFFDAALIAADKRFPRTIPVVKQELMRIPLVGRGLELWEAIPVARDGIDTSPLRAINQALKDGRAVCIAPEGTRNKTGHLGSMNRTLVKVAIKADERGIPVFPIAAEGADLALPKGSLFPRRAPITVISGPLIDLSPWHKQKLSDEELVEPARLIRSKIALLLPERNQPLPESVIPVLA